MRNILYIGEKVSKIKSGADAVNKRNYIALQTLFGTDFHHYELKRVSKLNTLFNLIKGNVGTVRSKDYQAILKYIDSNNISSVFLWSSKLGKLAQKIKNKFPNVEVITFFHNIEKQYYEEELKFNRGIKTRLVAGKVILNEQLAVDNTDLPIVLNDRDDDLLKRIYNRSASFHLPISFADNFDEKKRREIKKRDRKPDLQLLFVGSNFFANVEGLKWFIKNVLPKLDDTILNIVGMGMNTVFSNSEKIVVKGYVEDLTEEYYKADAVIAPIFSGGGMKTKTAEALMYGMPIVGTKEAFEGYRIDGSSIGGYSDSAEDMVQAIKRLKNREVLMDCHNYAREIFSKNYSLESSVKILSKYLLR